MGSPSPTDAKLRTRIRQQEVIAALGQQALKTDDLDQLMHDAVTAVTETLETDYCSVVELRPGSDEGVVRYGVGWRPGVVGRATVPVDRTSPTGYALRLEQPSIVDDLRTEERFDESELLADHGAVSAIGVVIGSTDDPWGVMGTYATERRKFTEHDANFVQNVANVLASAIENERTQSELEEIYGRISDAFFALDEEWRFTHLNERAHEIINPKGRTLVGENIWEAFPEAIGRKFKSKYEEAMYEQRTVVFEEYYPEPLDTWFEVRAYPSETGLSVYFRDVTERKRRKRDLEESERRYRTLVEQFPNGVVALVDENVRYQTVGGNPLDVANVTVEKIEGKPVREALDPELAAELVPRYERALAGESSEFEMASNGRVFDVRIVPVRDDDGEVFGALGMSQDVTERREYERRLAESERRYRTLAESFPNGLVTLFDESGEYTLAAGRGFDCIDIQPTDVEGRHFRDVWDEETANVLEPAFDAALAGEERSVEFAYGGREWVVDAVPITNERGDVFAGMMMAQDVTEQVEREHRLEEVVEELETSNERLEQFAYAASHDLQEPLRMVSSYLQLIESRYASELDESGTEFLEFAVDGAERMRGMINGLLAYSRVDTRGKPFEPVDLNAVLADVRADLRVRIEESDAEIEANPLPRVRGDEGQLRQVFQNLLDNAIEYSGGSSPTVSVTAEREGPKWLISIADEGIGIDVDDADRIFEVFQSLHPPDDHPGSGIGLALCERIVERHGGEIWVDSEPGEGSTFSFTLSAEDEDGR